MDLSLPRCGFGGIRSRAGRRKSLGTRSARRESLRWLMGVKPGLDDDSSSAEGLAERILSERKGFRGPGLTVSEGDWMPGTG